VFEGILQIPCLSGGRRNALSYTRNRGFILEMGVGRSCFSRTWEWDREWTGPRLIQVGSCILGLPGVMAKSDRKTRLKPESRHINCQCWIKDDDLSLHTRPTACYGSCLVAYGFTLNCGNKASARVMDVRRFGYRGHKQLAVPTLGLGDTG